MASACMGQMRLHAGAHAACNSGQWPQLVPQTIQTASLPHLADVPALPTCPVLKGLEHEAHVGARRLDALLPCPQGSTGSPAARNRPWGAPHLEHLIARQLEEHLPRRPELCAPLGLWGTHSCPERPRPLPLQVPRVGCSWPSSRRWGRAARLITPAAWPGCCPAHLPCAWPGAAVTPLP